MELAVGHFQAGRQAEAEQVLTALATAEPGNSEARYALATLALGRQEVSKAVAFLDDVLALESTHARALLLRSRLARELGDAPLAVSLAPRLLQEAKGRSDFLFEAGLSYFTDGNFAQAIDCFRSAWGGRDTEVEAAYWFGKTLLATSRVGEARKVFEWVVARIDQKVPLLDLAELCLNLGEPSSAEGYCRKCIQLDPKDERGHLLLARCLISLGRTEEAGGAWSNARAVSQQPERVLTAQGFLLQSRGFFEEAGDAFRSAAKVNPQDGYAYSMIAQSRKIREEDRPWVMGVEAKAQEAGLGDDDLRHIHFALGKSYHDLKEFELAAKHYELGNQFLRKSLFGDRRPDSAGHVAIVDSMKRTFRPEIFASNSGISQSSKPIFVVGMIRSGTTLVEQIISSHSSVAAAGELTFWQQNWVAFVDLASGRIRKEFLEIGAPEYLAIVDAYGKDLPRVTDKNPANYMAAGLLAYTYPRAKIVCVRRNPIDTAMSIWMTAMRTDADFQGDKPGIVAAIKTAARMNDYWSETLPADVFHTVRYEDIIENREPTTCAIMDFLGLEWDDACLSPESNNREVLTPSFWQVRQAVYGSSVDRWKPYEPWLGEFRELLEE